MSSETVICQVPDVGSMLESYGNRGIDFIIDVGPRVATVSTVRSRSLNKSTCSLSQLGYRVLNLVCESKPVRLSLPHHCARWWHDGVGGGDYARPS